MKHIIAIIASSLVLLGCRTQQPQSHISEISFGMGSTRETIMNQLKSIRAKILKNSPEFISAEFSVPESKRRMRVEFCFVDGKLNTAKPIPQ